MKNSLIVVLIIMFGVSIVSAAYDDNTPTQIPEVFEWHRSGLSATVTFEAPALLWDSQKDGTEIPLLAGSGEAFVAGGPRLPLYSKLVVAPAGMDVRIVDVRVKWEDAGVHAITHDPGSKPELPEEHEKWEPAAFDMKVYTDVANRSSVTAAVGETGRWRDIRVAQLTVNPLRYNASTGQSDLANEVEINLEYIPSAEPDGYDPPGVSEAMYALYDAYVLGALDELDEDEVMRGTYLIICRPTLVDLIAPLVEWRIKCGFNVIVATTNQTGTSALSIHNFIDDIYEDGEIPLEYVVLFGDTDDTFAIPTYHIPGSPAHNAFIPTDHKYTINVQLNQGVVANVLPRYLIGRLSVDTNTQATIVVNKILQYEVTPDDGDLDRFEEALMIWTAVPGMSVQQTKRWVRRKMLDNGFDQIDEQYYPVGNGTAAGISNSVNGGLSWVNYRGYGHYYGWWLQMGDFTSDRVSALTNNAQLPVVTSMVCGTGNFDHGNYDPCFGETWLRTGTPNSLKGAVAFVGPGELNTHTRWNNIMDGGWYRGLFDFDLRTMGQCLIAAKIEVSNAYPDHWNENPGGNGHAVSVWFYWHNYNILGDPALQLRREIPEAIFADHIEDIPENATHIRVEAWIDDDNETLLEGGRVIITNADNTIIGSGFTDEDGFAYVYFDEPPTGEGLEITITRPDMMPYLGELNSIDDSGLQITEINMLEDPDDEENNDNNEVNPGELIIPAVVFEVVEPDGIENLSVTVSLASDGGEVTEETEDIGNVGFGADITLTEPRIRIDEYWQNEEPVEIVFTFEGDNDFEQSHLVIFDEVVAPVINFSDVNYGEEITPGDDMTLSIILSNIHPDLDAGSINGVLSTTSEDVTVTDSEGEWNDLPADDETESNDDFEITLNDSTYPGRELYFSLDVTTEEGYKTAIPFSLMVDGWDDENSPTGPIGPGYWFFENNDEGYGNDVEFEYTSLDDLGDEFGINDTGNNMDDIETIDLPFDFPYWDDTYDEISVSSNGFLTFGETDFPFLRNRPIPGTLMPEAAVCIFWDDLASGDVYEYHNEEEGWFGIEWYNVRYTTPDGIGGGQPTGDQMKFQIRLLDPMVHGAPGGLGIIVLMYDELDNGDTDGNYCTVGITSPDGRSGLEYEFNDEPAATATGVHDGLQIIIAVGSGGGIDLPDLSYYPPLIQISAGQDEPINSSFDMSNVGGLRMSYRLWIEGIWHSWLLGNGEEEVNIGIGNSDPEKDKMQSLSGNPIGDFGNSIHDSNPILSNQSELDGFGGPDSFGYYFYDSDEFYGPAFDWIDIVEDTNEVVWEERTDPRVSNVIVLPFDFPFYGEKYDTLWITECGYVVFIDPHGMAYNRNTPLPGVNSPFAGIFPFWEDIGIDEGGAVYAKLYADSLVVTWHELHHLAWAEDDGPYSFQLLITSDGAIHFQYGEMNPSFRSCTVGIQDHEGLTGLEIVRYLDAVDYLHAEKTTRIIPPVNWLSLESDNGRLAPEEMITLDVTGNTADLEPGLYYARIVLMDETSGGVDMIPFTLSVFEGDEPGAMPQVAYLHGESTLRGEEFMPFALDPHVYDSDNTDDEISWFIYGGDGGVTVEIDSSRIAHAQAAEEWDGETTLIFRAFDPEMNWVELDVVYDTTDQNDPPRFMDASTDYYLEADSFAMDTVITLSIEISDPENDSLSVTWYHRDEEIAVDTTSVSVTLDDTTTIDSVWVVVSDGESDITHQWWMDVYYYNAVGAAEETLPLKFALENVYPNPFNSTLSVAYALPDIADVQLRMYNILGREVMTRTLYQVNPGRHRATLKGNNWSSGIYFLQWQAGGVSEVRKVVLLK